jgi:hypothetical protein
MDSSDDDFRDDVKKKRADNKENDVHKFPTVNKEVPAKYLQTKRGAKSLIDPYNYLYHKNREYNGQTYWRCIREKSTTLPRYSYRKLQQFRCFLCVVTHLIGKFNKIVFCAL